MSFLLNPYIYGQAPTSLSFVSDSRHYQSSDSTTITFNLGTYQAGDIAFVSAFWDGDATSVTMPAGWTKIVDNIGGTEYPEGGTFYRVMESGDSSSVTVTSSRSDQGGGCSQVFRPNGTIRNVAIGNTASSDGPSALNSTIAADSPTTVAAGTVRVKIYFLTGRITGAFQNPTPTFAQSGWTWDDGGTSGMDYGYKILTPGTTDVSNQVTTNDQGRQGHHLMSLTLS